MSEHVYLFLKIVFDQNVFDAFALMLHQSLLHTDNQKLC